MAWMRWWGPHAMSVGLPEAPTAPSFVQQAVLGLLVLTPWVLSFPKLVCLGAWACFDPIEPDLCSLIGCTFCLNLWSVFPAHEVCFHSYFTCIQIITNTRGNGQ